MKQPTNQAEKWNFHIISFPESEKTKQEIMLEKSVSDLVDMMRELADLGRMTGREDLPRHVYLTVCNVLADATRFAIAKERRGAQ